MSTRIIEARAVISADDQASAKIAAMAKRINEVTKAQALVNRAGGQELLALARQVDDLQSRLAKVQGFRQLARDVDQSSIAMRRANQEAARLKSAFDQARQIDAASRATKQLGREYDAASRAAKQAQNAFRSQGQALRETRSSLEAAGMPINRLASVQRDLETRTKAATAALERQKQAVLQGQAASKAGAMAPAGRAGSAYIAPSTAERLADVAAGVGSAQIIRRTYENSRDQVVEFDREARRQREVLELSPRGQALFAEQAMRLGYETKYSNVDFLRGQMTIAQGLPKELQRKDDGGVVRSLVEETRFLAEALDKDKEPVSVDMAAELLRARLNAGGYDMSSPEAARKSARLAANQLVELSKISGMNYEDLRGYTKFGESTGRTAGLDQAFMDASVAALRRVGFEGSMGGNFIRAIGMRLSAPNRNTLDALNAAGLRYQDYQRPGNDFSDEGFADMLRRRFGRDMDDDTRSRIRSVFDDEGTLQDQGQFITAVTSALVDGGFAKKNKKGEINAQDRERIAKAAEAFYRMNVEGVDTQRLMMDLLFSGKITPALARYLGGQEHGGRLLNLKPGDVQQDMKTMANVPDDRAERIARETNAGVGGAYLRMQGAIETMFLRIGQSMETPFKAAFQSVDAMATAIAGLPDRLIQFGVAVSAAGTALLGLSGFLAARGLIASVAGGGSGAAAAAATAASRGASFVGMGFRGLGYGVAGMATYEAVNAIGGAASGVGHIAAGKYYTPTDAAAAADLRMQVGEIDAKIEGIRARLHPSMAGAPNTEIDRLSGERQELINRLSTLKATVEQPIDVTGKVETELKGKADVNVTVRVQGEGRVTGMSATSTGHVRANAGTAMSEFDTP